MSLRKLLRSATAYHINQVTRPKTVDQTKPFTLLLADERCYNKFAPHSEYLRNRKPVWRFILCNDTTIRQPLSKTFKQLHNTPYYKCQLLFFGRHASIDITFHRLRCESNTKMIGGGLHSSAENVSSLALALPLDIVYTIKLI